MPRKNVVVFGGTGSGKTSLINMLVGASVGQTSPDSSGCTAYSTAYPAAINGVDFTLHDTVGLGETNQGRVTNKDAIIQLYCLLRTLEDGVSLLVFVMRDRISNNTAFNWKLLYTTMCRGQVPIALVVTGLENEEDMDGWWPRNLESFRANGMSPSDHACTTAIRGQLRDGEYDYQEEYDGSKEKIRGMIRRAHLGSPWKMEPVVRVVAELSTYNISQSLETCYDATKVNVVFFGGAGSGKTSLINMLVGYDVGLTSSGAQGCTFENTPYLTTFGGITCTLHDTAGLNEADFGRVPQRDSIIQLYHLLRGLKDGVHLLVYVLKAPARIRPSTIENWQMFYEIMCQRKVPIAIVITGLEQEENMDDYWPRNQQTFRANGLIPHDHAGVVTFRGRLRRGKYMFQREFDESRRKVQDMIVRVHQPTGWKAERRKWMNEIIYTTTYESRKFGSPTEKKVYSHTIYGAIEDLRKTCRMSEEEAESLAKTLEAI